jgi:crotonobetainyl-CoA:carnitine CoA-transferase CaiB-like acyl-CoA transferase
MQILEGIRLIEVADWGFVPSAGTVLGDWGADVIKIEHPVRGDPMRGLVTSGLVPGARGVNFFVEHLSRNKRSIGVDLNRPEGRAVLYKLVSTADIFLTNFLPDARERMHITYEDLRKVNPRLIYAKGHGQGQRGPDAGRGGYDGCSFWARGGVADRLTTPGQPLVQQRPAFGDFTGGMFLAGGIAGALFHRERTGEGLEVDVSLLGNAAWIMAPDIVAAMTYGFRAAAGRRRWAPPIARAHLLRRRRQGRRVDDAAERALLAARGAHARLRGAALRSTVRHPEKRQHEAAALVDELTALFATRPRRVGRTPERLRMHLGAAAVAVGNSRRSAGDRQRLRPGIRAPITRAPSASRRARCSSPTKPRRSRRAPRSSAPTRSRRCSRWATWEDIAGLKEAGAIC